MKIQVKGWGIVIQGFESLLPRLGLSTSAMSYENKIDKTESVDSVTSFGHHSDAIVLNLFKI